jgi:hypothetical protein
MHTRPTIKWAFVDYTAMREAQTMRAFTYKVLSQYVGTSREIVTHYMSQFRRGGYVQYSRRVIALRQRALIEWQTAPPTAAFKTISSTGKLKKSSSGKNRFLPARAHHSLGSQVGEVSVQMISHLKVLPLPATLD